MTIYFYFCHLPAPQQQGPQRMRFMLSTLVSGCCKAQRAVFSDSGTKESFFCRVHFVPCEASTQQSSTTGQYVHPHALFMSRCWQSAIRNSVSPSWNPSFVNGTYLYETVSLRSVTVRPLIIRTQDVLCRGRGARRGHTEATHKMEHVLKFHVWQQ